MGARNRGTDGAGAGGETEPKTLIFIPTYNEAENAPRMCEALHGLGLDADVLIVDDNSPDGTGRVLESLRPRFPRLTVLHRAGKFGIGSAHLDGIRWAYDHGYERLVTMDGDFTHSPQDIPRLVGAAAGHDVGVGSRFLRRGSLSSWPLFRKLMTIGGHWLTKSLLGMPWDASGAFRVYDLTRLPREVFARVRARGYPFFVESLHLIWCNGFDIVEIAIAMPFRRSGRSKMSARDICVGVASLLALCAGKAVRPSRFRLDRTVRAPAERM